MIIPPENLEDIARKFGFGKYAGKGIIAPKQKPFSITEDKEFYIINGIKINEEVKTVKWRKKLLTLGFYEKHTQDLWLQKTKEWKIRIPSLPTYMATIISLYDNKDIEDRKQKDLVEKIRNMFETDFDLTKQYVTTSTRIIYDKQGPDNIIHDYSYDTEYQITEGIAGYNIWTHQNSELKRKIKALTETDDIEKIEKAIRWITKTKPALLVLEEKQNTQKVVALSCGNEGASGTRFYFFCNGETKVHRIAHGVIVEN